MRAIVAFVCALAVTACAQGNAVPGDAAAGTASPDTLRGVVAVVGSEPGTTIALLTDEGRRAVALVGESATLERVQGLEVMVRGARQAGGGLPSREAFRVESFSVRAVGEVPAWDGRLVREGERYLLATADGRRLPLEHVPAELRGRVGARVWISGVPGRFPDSFGVVEEAR